MAYEVDVCNQKGSPRVHYHKEDFKQKIVCKNQGHHNLKDEKVNSLLSPFQDRNCGLKKCMQKGFPRVHCIIVRLHAKNQAINF